MHPRARWRLAASIRRAGWPLFAAGMLAAAPRWVGEAGAQSVVPFYYPTPAATTYVTRKGVAYTKSNGTDVVMDVYAPRNLSANERVPVMIFLNTWAGQSQRGSGLYVGWAAAATAHRMIAIVSDAAPDFPTGFDALLEYVRAHAAELHADTARIIVYAASANVGAALPALQDPRRTGIAAAVIYYGAGPVRAFRPDLPVLFVRAGLDRPGMNEAIDSLVTLALSSNAPVRVINYAAGHHAFEMRDDTDATRDVIEQTFRFVATATDPKQRAASRARLNEVRAAGAMSSEDYATAASLYAEALAERPDDTTLRLAYGEALLGARRYKEARAQFDRLKDKGLGYRDLGLPAANAAIADGDPDAAIAWLKTIPRRFLPRDLAADPAFASIRDRADFKALFE